MVSAATSAADQAQTSKGHILTPKHQANIIPNRLKLPPAMQNIILMGNTIVMLRFGSEVGGTTITVSFFSSGGEREQEFRERL